jgi:16S rRNA (guanine527-N7)-methyltransferase
LDQVSVILKYFPGLSDRQIDQFNHFSQLLADWNGKINLVSRKDTSRIFTNHILHSLAIAKLVEFKPGSGVVDIGTGGGFPGIPLAILFPEANFSLVDSIGKKIMAVGDMVDHLGLKNASPRQLRAEDIEGKFDFTVSRAVTRMLGLYTISARVLKKKAIHPVPNGVISLKGGDLTDEMKELGKPAEIFPINRFFTEEFFETKKIVFIPCQ